MLPLFLIQNWLMGKVLLSSPFAVYGGILADSAESREALCREARALGERLGVKHVELRNAWEEQTSGLAPAESLRHVHASRSGRTKTPFWKRSRARPAPRCANRSRRAWRAIARFPIRELSRGSIRSNLRKLGTPSFPPCHFQALLDNFRGMADIREVRAGGKHHGAVLSFYFRDQVLPYYGASDPAANALAPNNFMYFDLMRWAGRNGYRTFDFGRSKRVKGSYDFKIHWGMVERELPYEVMLIGGKEPAECFPG